MTTFQFLFKLGDCLQLLLKVCWRRWPEGCPVDWVAALCVATYNVRHMNHMNMAQLEVMQEAAELVFNRHLAEHIAAKMQSWSTFVRTELQKGGGLLFKYISKKKRTS